MFAFPDTWRHRLAPLALASVLSVTAGVALAATAGAAPVSLRQVLEQGLADSPQLQRADRQQERDEALVALNRSLLLPQLDLVGLGSYTQVGSSVGVITNLPTLGDISLSLENGGYALLRNSFGNVGVVLGADLLPLRQFALIAASRSQRQSSLASRREIERQVRFELVSTYRQLQLAQGLLPVWRAALLASTAIENDARAFLRLGLAARIDLLRASSLRAADLQGMARAQAQLEGSREQLASLLGRPATTPLEAADPLQELPPWPEDLPTTVERSTRGRPLLEALSEQERAKRQQARAARAALFPSLKLVAGAGYSGNQLSAPVLQQGGAIDGASVPLPLPSLEQSGSATGSFYNWGVALLVRQPLWDGGRAGSGARLAERDADLVRADEDVARQRIRREVSRAWSDLQAAPATIAAAREAVTASERAVRDARLRYRAMVDPITEVLLVERDLQVARASLLGALTRQALDRAVLERETGMESGDP